MAERRRAAAVIVAMLLLAGCAGIPHGGAVRIGRELPAAGGLGGLGEVDVRVLPPAPLPGMSPSGIVRGFLRAMVNADSDYEIARTYLTHRAGATWNAGTGVTTYDDNGVQILPRRSSGAQADVELVAPRRGFIDQRGDFAPRTGAVRSTFSLTRAGGQWRIDRLPSGVLLSTLDAQRSFRLADVFYLNHSGTTLVPEQVLLRPQPRITTALVRALLARPGDWLGPAVRSGFPAETDLLGNVPVDPSGIAQVNFSASIRQATATQLKALSAQLLWTLRQVPDVTAVQILADGAPLAVPGWDGPQPRTAWATYDPAAPPAISAGLYRHGASWRTTGAPVPGLERVGAADALAVSHDGAMMATASGGVLYAGRSGQNLLPRLRGTAVTPPTYDPEGNVWTVITHGLQRSVVEVTGSGTVRRIPADAALVGAPVQQLRLSRDGSRVAAVVGPPGNGRLLIGRVSETRAGERLEAFRPVLADWSDIRGVAWQNAAEVVVTARESSGARAVVAVDVDGYDARTITLSGLHADPVDVAAAPGRPLLVVAGTAVWQEKDASGWRRLGSGNSPVYAD